MQKIAASTSISSPLKRDDPAARRAWPPRMASISRTTPSRQTDIGIDREEARSDAPGIGARQDGEQRRRGDECRRRDRAGPEPASQPANRASRTAVVARVTRSAPP